MQVCLEYFARFFDVQVEVYRPLFVEPMVFPHFLDRDEETGKHKRAAFSSKSVYKLAHVPANGEEGDCERPNHYVPLWGQHVSFSPVSLSLVISTGACF